MMIKCKCAIPDAELLVDDVVNGAAVVAAVAGVPAL